MKRSTIQIAKPSMGDDEWYVLKEPILNGWIGQGEKVLKFEEEFARYHDVKYAIAVSSGTAALHLSLLALGVGPGDEVIVPSYSWIATANAVIYCGAKPIFVDINKKNFNLNAELLKDNITDKTKAIIPVHQFGLCCDMEKIYNILPDNIKILEDAACASGARYKNNFAGGLADIAAFSFHPRKNISTGEGGMITTNSLKLAETVASLRNHGINKTKENFEELGFNYRLTDLQAAIGIVQLSKLSDFIDERNKWASWYNEQFKDLDAIDCPTFPSSGQHSWQSYVIYLDANESPLSRNSLMQELRRNGIETREGNLAIHKLPLYNNQFDIDSDELSVTNDCHMNTLAIPLHNSMNKKDFEYVAENILNLLTK